MFALPLVIAMSLLCQDQVKAPTVTPAVTPMDTLKFLVGEWESKFDQSGADGKPETVEAKVSSRFVLDGKMLQIEEKQTVAGKAGVASLVLVTFDTEANTYRAFVHTSGAPWITLDLTGKSDAKSLTLSDDMGSGASSEFIYEKLDGGKYKFTSVVKNGTQVFRDAATYSPSKRKP